MSFFVTGTDTNVGKTLISCALLQGYAAKGMRTVGMKPVAAGCDDHDMNDDVKALLAAGSVRATRGQVNPYVFYHPVAPYLAAKFSGVLINLDRIAVSYRELAAQADVVIVEGAGGYRVPLGENEDGADLAKKLGLPVILVVGMRLGCMSHALLSEAAIKASGLKLAGWVANCVDDQTMMLDETIAALAARIAAPLLGVVPYQPEPDPSVAATYLTLPLLQS